MPYHVASALLGISASGVAEDSRKPFDALAMTYSANSARVAVRSACAEVDRAIPDEQRESLDAQKEPRPLKGEIGAREALGRGVIRLDPGIGFRRDESE